MAVWLISIACSGNVKFTGGSPGLNRKTSYDLSPATPAMLRDMSGREPRFKGEVTRAP